MIFEIRMASLNGDFQNKLDTALIRRAGNAENEEYFFGRDGLFYGRESQKNKEDGGMGRAGDNHSESR